MDGGGETPTAPAPRPATSRRVDPWWWAVAGLAVVLLVILSPVIWRHVQREAAVRTAAAVLLAADRGDGAAVLAHADGARLAASLTPQIKTELDARAEREKAVADSVFAARGLVGAIHALATMPVLLAAPLDPKAAQEANRTTQRIIGGPPAPPPSAQVDPAALAAAATAPGEIAGLIHRARDLSGLPPMTDVEAARALVRKRLGLDDKGGAAVTLRAEGLVLFPRRTVSTLRLERRGPLTWTLVGLDLPIGAAPAFLPEPQPAAP